MKITNLGTSGYASFYVACELYKQMSQQNHSKLGLATGGTMVDVYRFLVQLLRKNKLDVSEIETFNLDEYVGLDAQHEQSYHTYMNEMLFKQYPYFNTSLLDLTESTINGNSRYFDNEVDVPKQAVSMGLSTILKAHRIILLAFGEKKRAAIEKLAENEVNSDVPATILHAHPNVEIYVDDEAAPRL